MKILLFSLCFFISINFINAQQVGINTENPNALSVLDIHTSVDSEGKIIPRGVMVPRLTEAQRDSINLSDIDLANGLLIYNTDEDCFNYFNKTENKWRSLCGNVSGNAVIAEAYCDSLKISGDYQAGKPLNSSHYLSIPVNVIKAGLYYISAISDPPNGYYYSTSGTFLATGVINVTVPGYGTPILAQTDSIIVTINGTAYCGEKVEVASSAIIPDFTLVCDDQPSRVSGEYVAGTSLQTNNNQVLVTINANEAAFGSIYKITTDTINGYYFYGEGVIVQSSQVVVLSGQGTPATLGSNTFKIMTNAGNGTNVDSGCKITVRVAARTMTIIGVGENNTYYLGVSTNGMYRLLNNSALFGANQISTFPVNGFNIIRQGVGNGIDLSTVIINNKPDIIIIKYNWVVSSYGASNLQALTDFVNAGGVLILCSDGEATSTGLRNIRCQNIVNSIFETTTFAATGNTIDNTQPFATVGESTAPVLDGPFLNLRGLSMARDVFGNFNFTTSGLTSDAAIIAWDSDAKSSVRSFMHKTKGFVFIGDGGSFAYLSGNIDPYAYSMKLDSSFNPAVNIWSNPDTYNSYLFCNIMAWAIDYIQNQ